MTIQLMVALFVEGGVSDRVFLETVVRRTAQELISHRGVGDVEIPLSFDVVGRAEYKKFETEPLQFLEMSRDYKNYDILVFHKDADSPSRDNAYQRNFEPARNAVLARREEGEKLCDNVLAVIPVQTVEAWVLADKDKLYEILNTQVDKNELGLPPTPAQVESDATPKRTLQEVLRKASEKKTRNRRVAVKDIFPEFGKEVRLEELDKVPAYQQFKDDLTTALIKANIIQ